MLFSRALSCVTGRIRVFSCLLLLVLLTCVVAGSRAQSTPTCTGGACVTAGARIASFDTQQSVLLNLLFSALLGDTSVSLTAGDWDGLANANVNLDLLLTELNGGVAVADPSVVLNTPITLGQFQLAMVSALEADGDLVSAGILQVLPLNLPGFQSVTFKLGDLLQLSLPDGGLAAVDLNVLELVMGSVQLFNHSNVVTTPTPIEINTGAIPGLDGLAKVKLWLQAIEPPTIVCGPQGTQFYSAAVRMKLDLELVQGLDLAPITNELNTLEILEVLRIGNANVSADVLKFQVYVDVGRAQGTIEAINLAADAVTLKAKPGLVSIFIGTIDDARFFSRGVLLSAADFAPLVLTKLDVSVMLQNRSLIYPYNWVDLIGLNIPIDVRFKAVADSGSATEQTVVVNGSFPKVVTVAAGTGSVTGMLATLVNDFELELVAGSVTVTVGSLVSLPLPLNTVVNTIVDTIKPVLQLAVKAVINPVLDLVLGDIVDGLLRLLGIGIGEAVFTVNSSYGQCPVTLALAKTLIPATDPGRFDLLVSAPGVPEVAIAPSVGDGGMTAPFVTVPGTTYTLGETAVSGTDAGSYASTWQCKDDQDTVLASGTGTSFTFQAPPMVLGTVPKQVTCRFTNTLSTGSADLSITKSDGATAAVPGGSSTYTLVVKNNGPDDVVGAQVHDAFPAGMKLASSWTCTATTGGACTAASGGSTGDEDITVGLNLPNGATATITVPVTLSADPGEY